jgi:hypothetical protein
VSSKGQGSGDDTRVVIGYRAPIWVTVNVATSDVERIYLDDESLELDPDLGAWTGADASLVADADLARRATVVAEQTDWPSTDIINRCQMWRGADGGPADFAAVALAALRHALDPNEAVPERGALVAAANLMHDFMVWQDEHSVDRS